MTDVADQFPATQIKVEDLSAARKKITLEIASERIKGKIEEAYGDLQRDAVLPGFRRGRAPKRLIEKRFGGELQNTVKNQLIAEGYQKAVEDNKISALGEPEIDLSKVVIPESGPLVVTLEVEVTPEFALPSIEKIAVKKPKLEANEERLNLAVENLRRHFGHWHDSEGAAEKGNAVLADVKVQTEDNTIIAEEKNVSLAVNAGSIAGVRFEDLGDKLAGKKAGDSLSFDGTIPADHVTESLRGKKITVSLTINKVSHEHLPEVNEDFAKMLGFDNLEALKKDLKDRLVVQLEQETKGAMAQQVYRYLIKETSIDLPPNLSQRQQANVLRRKATELMERGVPETEIIQHIDQLRIASGQQASVDLKLFFILGKLAEQFSIDVNEAELNARVAQIAGMYGRRPEKLKQQMAQTGQLEQLFLQVRDGKVVDKILETAEITEVDEKTLAEELKANPISAGPNVTGVSTAK